MDIATPHDAENPVATTVALSIAPAAAGAGVGLLLAETLDRDTRRVAAVTLIGVATLAALPWLVRVIGRKVTGPQSRRGRARTLSGIRDAAIGDYHYEDYNFEEMETEEVPHSAIGG